MHWALMLLPLVVFAGVLGVQWRVSAEEPLPAPLWAMAGTTAAAGLVHGGVTTHHAAESAVLGWAMAVMCVAQLTWAVWLLFAPTRRLVEVGVVGNLAVVALWTWTRLVGIPFGIAGGERQRIGGWDATCTLLEVAAVLCGLAALGGLSLTVYTRLRTNPST